MIGNVFSQLPIHNMKTAIVTDCKAKFYDDGGPSSNYLVDPNNNPTTYTLQIFVGAPITMTFNPNATQTQVGDWIRFYDGPVGSALISQHTNVSVTNQIPTIVANSGSLTVIWYENGNSAGIGWNANWFSTPIPPTAPTASLAAQPGCLANQITLNLTNGVMCDSVKAKYFVISGPMFPGVTSATPVPCINGTTTAVQLNLTSPLNKNCTYTVNSTFFIKDNCDSVYRFQNVLSTFSLASCPFTGSISMAPTGTICAGMCATITAVPESNCLNYTYAWNDGNVGAGPHVVCPTVTTVYSCTLTETTTLATAVLTRTLYVIDPQINALASNSVCQSAGNINLTASPTGGVWSGPGITPSNSLTGVFNPYNSGAGTFTITYTLGGCNDKIQITVLAINVGSSDAACVGGPNFNVSGGTPAGGTWSGSPYINAAGNFTPSVIGTHSIMYTIGPCSQVKNVYVNNLVVPATTYSICKSVWWKNLTFTVSPPGGRFYGTGITNIVAGTFSPTLAGPGPHVITYSLANGCSSTFEVHVLDIYVPQYGVTCPAQAPFTLTPAGFPAGGTWAGTGITNSVVGAYNPAAGGMGNHNDALVYTAPNGCTDTTLMLAWVTTIVKDSLFFCDDDDSIRVSDYPTLNHYHGGGVWTGPGVVVQGVNYYFKPKVSGPGVHTVYYSRFTCTDSIKMVVYPAKLPGHDSVICSTHPPFIIAPMPVGTTWNGTGITNPQTGLFDPGSVGSGTFNITYTNKMGCGDTVQMIVYPFQAANINNLGTVYCYKDTDIVFTYGPPGGTLTTTGGITTNTFNPSTTGAGTFMVKYTFGQGVCFTSDSVKITVYPQLQTTVTVSEDTLCLGQSASFTVTGNGGLPTVMQYTYAWSHGLLSMNNQLVVPGSTTIYTCVTTDGCSDPAVDSIRIYITPAFYPTAVTSAKKCYGEQGFATLNISPSSNYSYSWNTTPVQTGSTLTGPAGKSYLVKIKDLNTGCTKDTSVRIPGYNAIKALFSPNPNATCLPYEDNLVTFLDLSNGADSGYWSFNGAIVSYSPGVSPQHAFNNSGSYIVTLVVYNEGLCSDSKSMDICVLPPNDVFLPDIFSPNKDGNNDVLYVRGKAIKELKFVLYDRWGEKIFETTDVNLGWDGTYKGKDVDPAVYVYYMEAVLNNDQKIIMKGDITLVR